jgi:hypothetical protein
MNNKNEELKESLAHYGVLGMKWGRKRGKSASSSTKEKIKKKRNIDEELKNMSDDELRKRLNRMNMEKQYKDLSKSKVAEGRDKANRALKTAGKIAVKSVAIAGVFGGAKYLGEKYGLNAKQTLNLDRTFKIADILGRG